jgi:hypothetical protein
MTRRAALAALAVLLLQSACTYYVQPSGAVVPMAPAPSTYDRAFTAAAGAMRDQGLDINIEDRANGTIMGTRSGMTITANVRQQSDGSVRLQFDSYNARDQDLIERISRGYDARMGRY